MSSGLSLNSFRRILDLWGICARYSLHQLVPNSFGWMRLLTLFMRMHPYAWLPSKRGLPDDRLRLAMEDMGPVFIKLGQLLATRRDLLPPNVLDSLSALQDRVRPCPVDGIINTIQSELGRPLDELFMRFDREPLAAASIAQVHTAQLFDGREVVVKVLRPGIRQAVEQDMSLLRDMVHWIEQRWEEAKRLRLAQVVADYRQTLLDECDLVLEAGNTRRLRQNFLDSKQLYVPWVEDRYVAASVLVLERVYGTPVSQTERLLDLGISRKELAETGLTVFFTQLLRDNFFHADMHPGNVWVDAQQTENPRYIALDCAIMGSLHKRDQIAVARLGLALVQRDFSELVRVAWAEGWVPAGTSLETLEREVQRLVQPVLDQTIATLNFAPTLFGLLDLARRYRLIIPTQFVLLLKTLIHVEGLGRGLYPDLDIWSLSRPLLSHWLADQIGPQAVLHRGQKSLPQWMGMLLDLPNRLEDSAMLQRAILQEQSQQNTLLTQLSKEIPRLHRARRYTNSGILLLFLALALPKPVPELFVLAGFVFFIGIWR